MKSTLSDSDRFVDMLRRLAERQDRAALATLRRGLGKAPGTVVELYPFVVPYLPPQATDRDAWPYFVVAPLFALHPVDWPQDNENRPRNFGDSVGWLLQRVPERTTGLTARFRRLLQAELEELPEQLRHLVTLFVPWRVPVDWARLLRDLSRWDDPERAVQRAWARAFVGWGPRAEDEPA
ncbi:MAG: type I-E CRISPR-associated protein Cse2/CasB [Dehalococcoidia bacterium]|nr:type I-E CRISPR-associated protein Cse2/CasB [Dehalococcoidia bacterium]MDW8006246.1 type I-E CRISPR-associated protein Cse2/CasB [Thermomicrobium sp.]